MKIVRRKGAGKCKSVRNFFFSSIFSPIFFSFFPNPFSPPLIFHPSLIWKAISLPIPPPFPRSFWWWSFSPLFLIWEKGGSDQEELNLKIPFYISNVIYLREKRGGRGKEKNLSCFSCPAHHTTSPSSLFGAGKKREVKQSELFK